MPDAKKEKADALSEQSAVVENKNLIEENSSPDLTIDEEEESVKGKTLTVESDMRSLELKFYAEQLVVDEEAFKQKVVNYSRDVAKIIAIWHDRDLKKGKNDPFVLSSIKKHCHLYILFVNKEHKRIRTICKKLGIEYRQESDKSLFLTCAKTIDDFGACALYATHETKAAMKEGKAIYSIDEVITNMTREELEELRYIHEVLPQEQLKITKQQMIRKYDEFYQCGYELGDFDAKKKSLETIYKLDAKMSKLREAYDDGLNARLAEGDLGLNRLCVFIQGKRNAGKTWAAEHALKGKKMLTIEGGKTGKFDTLTPATEVIVVSDTTISDPLSLADNKVTRVYRRNSSNQPWKGKYLIITHNLSIQEWAVECGINEKQIDAFISRFIVCDIRTTKDGLKRLNVLSASPRGTDSDKQERFEMWKEFRDNFNSIIEKYVPKEETVFDWNGDGNKELFLPKIEPDFMTVKKFVACRPDAVLQDGSFAKEHINYDSGKQGFFVDEYLDGLYEWRETLEKDVAYFDYRSALASAKEEGRQEVLAMIEKEKELELYLS